MGNAEGLTSAIGEELTKLFGLLITRATTAVADPTTELDSGVLDSSSADGVIVTLDSGTFDASVVAGCLFSLQSDPLDASIATGSGTGVIRNRDGAWRFTLTSGTLSTSVVEGCRLMVTSGLNSGRSCLVGSAVDGELTLMLPEDFVQDVGFNWEAVYDRQLVSVPIASRDSSTQITLSRGGLPAAWTSQSWSVLPAPVTSLSVETTLDWPDSGLLGTAGAVHAYASKTNTTLDGVGPRFSHPRCGRIQVVAASSLADGEQLFVRDGFGHEVTFEFYGTTTFVSTPTVWPVWLRTDADVLFTSAELVAALVGEINDAFAPWGMLRAYAYDSTRVGLWCPLEGGSGLFHVTDTVADSGFETDGPRGLAGAVNERDPVIEALGAAATEAFRNGTLVKYATGVQLDDIGAVLGVPRILGLGDDRYRDLIARTAYISRHTRLGLEEALTALYNRGRFEWFEDMTFGSIRHGGTTYVRRANGFEQTIDFKAYVEGTEDAIQTGADTLDVAAAGLVGSARLSQDPIRLERTNDDDDLPLGSRGPGRLITYGGGASYDSVTQRVTLASGAFPAQVVKGDIFQWTTGLDAGVRGTIMNVDGGGAYIELSGFFGGVIPGASVHTMPDRDAGPGRYIIYRERPNYFMLGGPSGDEFLEAAMGSAWSSVQGGGNSTPTHDTTPDEYYLELNRTGTNAAYHTRDARADFSSRVSISAEVDLYPLLTNTSTSGLQLVLLSAVHSGADDLAAALGFYVDGNDVYAVAIDETGSPWELPSFGIMDVVDTTWVTVTLRVDYSNREPATGRPYVEILLNGGVSSAGYFFYDGTTDTSLTFGNLDVTNIGGATDVQFIRWVDWNIESTRDYLNQTTTGSTDFDFPSTLASDTSVFDAADDADPRRRVQIFNSSAVNVLGGSARGEWEVDTYASATEVTLRGVAQSGGHLFSSGSVQCFESRTIDSFRWPDSLGHGVLIETGPNAGGPYLITDILGGDFEPLSTTLANSLAFRLADPAAHCPVYDSPWAVLDGIPFPNDTTEVKWRLIPNFDDDAAIEFARVGDTQAADVTVTLADTPDSTVAGADSNEVMFEVESVNARSLYLEDVLVPDIIGSGTGASSSDGISVTLPGLTAFDCPVGPQMTVTITGDNLNTTRRSDAASALAGTTATMENGFGTSFAEADWVVTREQAVLDDGGPTRASGYLADNFGFWTRQFLSNLFCAAGRVLDFASLHRVTLAEGVPGLRLIDEDGDTSDPASS